MGSNQLTIMSSLPNRPRPGRRRLQRALYPYSILSIFIITIALSTPTLANLQAPHSGLDLSVFGRIQRRGVSAVDRRDPGRRPYLQPRQDNGDPFASTAVPVTTSATGPVSAPAVSSTDTESTITIQSTVVVTPSGTVTERASATLTGNATTGIETAPSSTAAPSPLPSAFDTSLGSNFTSQACPNFFNNFLNNATFRDCHPTSLLLQNSHSFFKTFRSPLLLSQALDASCGASLARCSPLMASLAFQLVQDANCGQDYRNQNPLVTQAHTGLVSYEALYRATCLKSSTTGNYCFADAISNTSNPADPYPYYTALGTNLPAASRPTCDQCLQDAMAIFAGYAANRNQPVSTTYMSTAQQIALGCGPSFVNSTVPVATISNTAAKHGALTNVSALLAFPIGLLVACLAF